jgi:TolA-binding protein
MYARADFLFYRSKDSLAVLTLDSLITLFPNHEVIDEAWFLKGNIYRHIHKYNKAIKSYQVIIDKYYDDVLADNALFVVADIYENALNNNEKAMELYKKLILDFPDSIYKLESRLRYRKLRGDKVIN